MAFKKNSLKPQRRFQNILTNCKNRFNLRLRLKPLSDPISTLSSSFCMVEKSIIRMIIEVSIHSNQSEEEL